MVHILFPFYRRGNRRREITWIALRSHNLGEPRMITTIMMYFSTQTWAAWEKAAYKYVSVILRAKLCATDLSTLFKCLLVSISSVWRLIIIHKYALRHVYVFSFCSKKTLHQLPPNKVSKPPRAVGTEEEINMETGVTSLSISCLIVNTIRKCWSFSHFTVAIWQKPTSGWRVESFWYSDWIGIHPEFS